MKSSYLHHLLFFSILMFLLACSKPKSEQNTNQSKATEQEFIRGMIKIDANHENDSISFCDNSQEYQIYLNDEVYEEARNLSQVKSPFYAEVYGQFATSSGSAILNVTQINVMSTEINLCGSPTTQSRAFGEEPFWSAVITDKKLDYTELGKEKRQYTLLSEEISLSKRYYQSNEVKLDLVRKLCRDTMSDSVYGWQAELTLDNKVRKGCAVISSNEMNASKNKLTSTK